MEKQYIKILIIGPSGSGKSTSIENLPKDRTFIFNLDNKILPFRSQNEFKQEHFAKANGVSEAIAAKRDEDIYVFDSFTLYSEEIFKTANLTQKGYDIYNYYNAQSMKFFNTVRNLDKHVIVYAIDDLADMVGLDGNVTTRRCLALRGRENKGGKVEARFTLVLFTGKQKDKYVFFTQSDGMTTAKTPKDMFSTMTIPNDVRAVLETACKYYGQEL